MADEVVTQPDHPGRMCSDAHPGIPHRAVAVPGLAQTLPASPMPLDPFVEGALESTVEDWTRYDEWAGRMLDYAAKAIAAAEAMDAANKDVIGEPRWSSAAQTLEGVARMCTDLACAASPTGALTPMTPPTITLGRM